MASKRRGGVCRWLAKHNTVARGLGGTAAGGHVGCGGGGRCGGWGGCACCGGWCVILWWRRGCSALVFVCALRCIVWPARSRMGRWCHARSAWTVGLCATGSMRLLATLAAPSMRIHGTVAYSLSRHSLVHTACPDLSLVGGHPHQGQTADLLSRLLLLLLLLLLCVPATMKNTRVFCGMRHACCQSTAVSCMDGGQVRRALCAAPSVSRCTRQCS